MTYPNAYFGHPASHWQFLAVSSLRSGADSPAALTSRLALWTAFCLAINFFGLGAARGPEEACRTSSRSKLFLARGATFLEFTQSQSGVMQTTTDRKPGSRSPTPRARHIRKPPTGWPGRDESGKSYLPVILTPAA
jgi:hypothetical protein